MAFLLLLALAALVGASAEHTGCPACGPSVSAHKIATVHPGEPAVALMGLATADECRAQCLASSPDVLFFQHYKTKSGELACFCLATCYSVDAADASEEAVIGSLCRDTACPAASACSSAPQPNLMFLGAPARVISRPFYWTLLGGNGTAANGTNATAGGWGEPLAFNGTQYVLFSNSSLVPPSNTSNSTSGNGTFAAAFGMSFEECRAYAASNEFPFTPFFTHLEAMSTCLLFDKCVGVAPAGTATAKSGSFCVPSLLEEPVKTKKMQRRQLA